MKEVGEDLFGEKVVKNDILREVYIAPPFSVIDTKPGEWRARRTKWLALGIKSELGRSKSLLHSGETNTWGGYKNEHELAPDQKSKTAWSGEGTSVFDPVICEIAYKWFCFPGSKIIDPFAGGSVRGIVAAFMGHHYLGLELRNEQVNSNCIQANEILTDEVKGTCKWWEGDSDNSLNQINDKYDFIFSCPPYADLEVYSDDPDDLSNMPYAQFKEKYTRIIKKAVDKLNDNCFACFVVGDVRDKDGFYYNFVSHTKDAFITAGAKLYNECILLNAIGSAPVRASMIFKASKKTIKIHQNILVFYKGDPTKIKQKYGNN